MRGRGENLATGGGGVGRVCLTRFSRLYGKSDASPSHRHGTLSMERGISNSHCLRRTGQKVTTLTETTPTTERSKGTRTVRVTFEVLSFAGGIKSRERHCFWKIRGCAFLVVSVLFCCHPVLYGSLDFMFLETEGFPLDARTANNCWQRGQQPPRLDYLPAHRKRAASPKAGFPPCPFLLDCWVGSVDFNFLGSQGGCH